MLAELCKELNNWDFQKRAEKHYGTIVIKDGSLTGVDFLQEGQYFRIVGSVFNDGIYQYPAVLQDETFKGSIWAMAIPDEVIALANEIEEWTVKYQGVDSPNMSPYSSESFGGYSYAKGGSSSISGGSNETWKDVFASRLNKWRKI